MNKEHDILENIRRNWSIILTIIAMIFAWANLNARVLAQAKEVDSVRTLLERVIVLEEHSKSMVEDISEIKADIKIIKQQTK